MRTFIFPACLNFESTYKTNIWYCTQPVFALPQILLSLYLLKALYASRLKILLDNTSSNFIEMLYFKRNWPCLQQYFVHGTAGLLIGLLDHTPLTPLFLKPGLGKRESGFPFPTIVVTQSKITTSWNIKKSQVQGNWTQSPANMPTRGSHKIFLGIMGFYVHGLGIKGHM